MFGVKLPPKNLNELALLSGALVVVWGIYNWLRATPTQTVRETLEAELPVPLIINDVRPKIKDKVQAYLETPPDVGVGKTNYGDVIYKKTYPIGDGNTLKYPYYMDLGKYATLLETSL